ncbi:putative G3BP-like protein [Lachnellula subtilissima]|uniref:Putative G3BP-like protein n=1 Tax=Lachnellula subtilissima TaxID=602034 RepID=A0A8H8UE81_9HELO|nr:putative G3BP-like protein [Lachnellula subtilissima]
MATNGNFTQQEQYTATSGAADSNASGNDLPKEEVAWYFVEQYYTTLSKSSEKLHLFYGKRSQFVSGLEGVTSNVSVGRPAIQERIRHLNFQDCKVRISNVDSQASEDSIVIQVIGETSTKSAELKKFCQTFVLAQQPTGYFVLNDIFRYIKEEGEEEPVEATQEETAAAGPLVEDVEMPRAQAPAEEAAPAVLDADVVDEKLETIETEPAKAVPTTNGNTETTAEAKDAPVAAPTKDEEAPTPEAASKAIEEEIKEPEKPKDPLPSPVPVASKPQPAAKPAQAAPSKPLSWAHRAAAAAASTPKPAVPALTPKTATPSTQARAAPSTTKPAATQATPAPITAAEKDKENTAPGGWQTAGDHAKRQNRPQSISGPPEKEGTMAYIRNVTEKLSPEELRSALESYGALIYFDINRTKNCAFVEYQTPEGYQAATNANPHQIAGEAIYVEPRKPKANAYGGNGYAGGRGGPQRGRGGFQDRQGSQGGRGNFGGQNRGRGGAPTPRGGRGAGQVATA